MVFNYRNSYWLLSFLISILRLHNGDVKFTDFLIEFFDINKTKDFVKFMFIEAP